MNNATAAFAARLKELRQETLGGLIGVSRGAISYYENGERNADIEILRRVSEYFHVTSDYLLGLTDTRSVDISVRQISDKLGINEEAIQVLEKYKECTTGEPIGRNGEVSNFCKLYLDATNWLLSSSSDVASNIASYLYTQFTHYFNFKDRDLKQMNPISELGLYDEKLNTSYSEEFDYLSPFFLTMIQRELMQERELIQQRRSSFEAKTDTVN